MVEPNNRSFSTSQERDLHLLFLTKLSQTLHSTTAFEINPYPPALGWIPCPASAPLAQTSLPSNFWQSERNGTSISSHSIPSFRESTLFRSSMSSTLVHGGPSRAVGHICFAPVKMDLAFASVVAVLTLLCPFSKTLSFVPKENTSRPS